MDHLIFLFAFIVTIFIWLIIHTNIEYKKGLKSDEISKEETDEEWLDRQW